MIFSSHDSDQDCGSNNCVSSGENMFSAIPTEFDSNQLAQLQKLLRLSFNLAEVSLDIMLSN